MPRKIPLSIGSLLELGRVDRSLPQFGLFFDRLHVVNLVLLDLRQQRKVMRDTLA